MSPQDVVERFIAAWNRMDMEQVYAMMAPDMVWDNIPMGPVHGIAGARELMAGLPPHDAIEFVLHHIAANGNVVMTERTDRFRIGGRWRAIRLMGVFEINGDGLIQNWRDYFDMAEFGREFGG